MTELYVYYKAPRANAELVRKTVARFPEVRLLVRDDESNETQTWMEIHTGPHAEASERELAEALKGLIAGQRHVERFRVSPSAN
ncbi:MAG TPA: DUF4936 family protein [Burkholderiaceae bacterium]|jgi:hypothetical protein